MGNKIKIISLLAMISLGVATSLFTRQRDVIVFNAYQSQAQEQLNRAVSCQAHQKICSQEDLNSSFSRIDAPSHAVFGVKKAKDWTAEIPGAQWIWSSGAQSTDVLDDQVIIYNRDLILPYDASNVEANLKISADDYYRVLINNNEVASDFNGENWKTESIGNYDASYSINPGSNVFIIHAISPAEQKESSSSNTAGLLYCLDVKYQASCDTCVNGDKNNDKICD